MSTKYQPQPKDQIVYTDSEYFVVWKDYQQKNFEVYQQKTQELLFSFFESYVHNFGSATIVAQDTIEEIQDD